MPEADASLVHGLAAFVRSRWHLAIVEGLSINCCGVDREVATKSQARHGQDVACVHDADGAAGPAAWGL